MAQPPFNGLDVYANDEPDDPNPGVMFDASNYRGRALTPDQARDLAENLVNMADALDEVEQHCPACGEAVDHCQGHGRIGDPIGQAILVEHYERGIHARCRIIAGCTLLREGVGGDALYVGPLAPALAVIADEGYTLLYQRNTSASVIYPWLHRFTLLSPGSDVAVGNVMVKPLMEDGWGTSAESAEEALRYVIGSEFGPLDAEYDADALRATLIGWGA